MHCFLQGETERGAEGPKLNIPTVLGRAVPPEAASSHRPALVEEASPSRERWEAALRNAGSGVFFSAFPLEGQAHLSTAALGEADGAANGLLLLLEVAGALGGAEMLERRMWGWRERRGE